jgi:phospholipid-binding lipoprotein MlaA
MMLGFALAGCARPPSDPAQLAIYQQNNDPFEPLNRKTFELNQFLDRILFRPIAKAYVFALPQLARNGVHNFLDNLKEPTLFLNNLLQGELKRAGITVTRFVCNSTIGLAGFIDAAGQSGLPRQNADFGQTLFVWGVKSGPYLILPIFGPSNPRDAIGQGVDSYADPLTILANDHGLSEIMTGRLVLGGVDDRAQVLDVLDDLEKNSVDFYAELRSMSQQHRAAELRHGETPQETPNNLYNDPGATAPAASPAPAPPAPAPTEKPKAGAWPRPQTASRR